LHCSVVTSQAKVYTRTERLRAKRKVELPPPLNVHMVRISDDVAPVGWMTAKATPCLGDHAQQKLHWIF